VNTITKAIPLLLAIACASGCSSVNNKQSAAPTSAVNDSHPVPYQLQKMKPGLCTSPPVYPSAARAAKQEGVVVLLLHINADGHVLEARVNSSSGYLLLDDEAIRGVSTCRMTSGRKDGVPTDGWGTFQVVWLLRPIPLTPSGLVDPTKLPSRAASSAAAVDK